MKRLYVEQRFNLDYQGPDFTPNIDKHNYFVTKVVNAISPPVATLITANELQGYCDDESWLVTVS